MKYFKQLGVRKVPIGVILNKYNYNNFEVEPIDSYASLDGNFLIVNTGDNLYSLKPNKNDISILSIKRFLERPIYEDTINKSIEELENYYINYLK